MADENEYKKVNINTGDAPAWAPEKVNDEIEGMYVDKRSNLGPNSSNLYTLQVKDGSFVAVWGSWVIDDNFKKIPLGAQVKIVYLGKQKTVKGDREIKNFDIYSKQIKLPEVGTDAPSDDVNPDDIPF